MDDKTLVERLNYCKEHGIFDAAEAGMLVEYGEIIARIEALEAALRDVFIHGHGEGWRGNQMRRDVKHEDAEKSWSLYVSNGALEKTIARKALESKP